MITINVARQADYVQFILTGHANFAEKGQDIVCAAASILVYTLVRRVDDLADSYDMNVTGNGEAYICVNEDTPAIRHTFDTILMGIRELARNYPDHVDFREEGVPYI